MYTIVNKNMIENKNMTVYKIMVVNSTTCSIMFQQYNLDYHIYFKKRGISLMPRSKDGCAKAWVVPEEWQNH